MAGLFIARRGGVLAGCGMLRAEWPRQEAYAFLNLACTLLCFQVPASLNSPISIDSAR